MKPDPSLLLEKAGIGLPLIGFYDAPDPEPFAPLIEPRKGRHGCVFEFYDNWLEGAALHITRENFGCPGCGNWLCGISGRSREDFVTFLAEAEGLRASRPLMHQWLDKEKPYSQTHSHLFIGPLKPDQYAWLKTVTFLVNPDQLSLLITGAYYHHSPEDPPAVLAPFGAGCMKLAPLFKDFNACQALIGATDIAMRQHLPSNILAFTANRPMFERLCSLDERSFLFKPFWKRLKKARGISERS